MMYSKNNIVNFLTFDVEEWFHANFKGVDFSTYQGRPTNLESMVDRLIDICAEYNVKSTSFILGSVAETKPQIVRKLFAAGHEISSHSYGHKLVYDMTPKEFKEDLLRSCKLLEDITGNKVLGFRAPSWSVKLETLPWYYDILEEFGLKYSSSVYPGKTFLFGIPGFPQCIHYPNVNDKRVQILEIPGALTTLFGKKIGFSGGFFLRFFPLWFIKSEIRKFNKKDNAVFIYLHPREIDKKQERLELPLKESLIAYWGINGCENKFRGLLTEFAPSFIRMRDVFSLGAASIKADVKR